VAVLSYGFLFIPFSLPAPSYNTIGAFGMLAAISLYGLAAHLLAVRTGEAPCKGRVLCLSIASACCWAAATIAYPSLIAAAAAFVGIAWLGLKAPLQRRYLSIYVVICLLAQLAAAATLLAVFGSEHLMKTFHFTNSTLHVSGGLSAKIAKMLALLGMNPVFMVLCLLSLTGGILLGLYEKSSRLVTALMAGLVVIMVVCVFFKPAALFLWSHDLVVLLALFGVHLPLRAIRQKDEILRLASIMYIASMVGGMVTVATASNGLFNFPVGGLLASCLSLGFLRVPGQLAGKVRTAHVALIAFAGALMMWISFHFIYGEMYGNPLFMPSARIRGGPFAGLLTSSKQVELIAAITSQLPQAAPSGARAGIVALGRLPAVYLLTSLSPIALTTWNFGDYPGDEASRLIGQLYENPLHRPELVLTYSDPWSAPLTVTEKRLLSQYCLVRTVQVNESTISLYQRSCLAPLSRAGNPERLAKHFPVPVERGPLRP
jgi:hypothetical protein